MIHDSLRESETTASRIRISFLIAEFDIRYWLYEDPILLKTPVQWAGFAQIKNADDEISFLSSPADCNSKL